MRQLPVLMTALVLALAGCGDEPKDTRQSGGGSTDTGAAPAAPQPSEQASGGCKQVAAPKPKEDGGATKPSGDLAAGRTYRLLVATNCGKFTIELDQKQAPNASASLVALAEEKFFDGTTFHRIVPDFVIQGGDPTGTGTGGPGYATRDKPPADARYTKGVVAMAKAGNEPPGAAGSQFYVVTGADAGLPPEYAIVGKVVEGQDVVDRIGRLGGADEQPTQTVVVQTVRLEQG